MLQCNHSSSHWRNGRTNALRWAQPLSVQAQLPNRKRWQWSHYSFKWIELNWIEKSGRRRGKWQMHWLICIPQTVRHLSHSCPIISIFRNVCNYRLRNLSFLVFHLPKLSSHKICLCFCSVSVTLPQSLKSHYYLRNINLNVLSNEWMIRARDVPRRDATTHISDMEGYKLKWYRIFPSFYTEASSQSSYLTDWRGSRAKMQAGRQAGV